MFNQHYNEQSKLGAFPIWDVTIIKELTIHSRSIFHTKHGVHGNEHPESETHLYKKIYSHMQET